MNEPIKKQPVDELFARKLTNLSLPPDERGFARLQARMNQQTQLEKVVFWRSPTFQRSMAAAACLVLAGTLGWYAQSTNSDKPVVDPQQTVARRTQPTHPVKAANSDAGEAIAQQMVPNAQLEKATSKGNVEIREIAVTKKPTDELAALPVFKNNRNKAKPATVKSTPVNDLIERKTIDEQLASVTPTPVNEKTTTAPDATAPRTLVVTIAEPDVLVAARQTAQEADQKIVVVTKNTTETGAGKLWRKIQQIRTGETAVADAPVDENEKGLLDRAYGQLKHSFQKNKPSRQ